MTLISQNVSGECFINFADADDTNAGQIFYGHNPNRMIFRVNDATRVTIDDAGQAIFVGDVTLDSDSTKLKLGDSQDLQISHNGTDSQITNLTCALQFTQLQNEPKLLQAFREGVANNIRAKIAQRGGKPALIRRIANPDSQEYKILQRLFPDDEFTNLMNDVNVAMGAMTSKNVIKGGSITATALGRQDAVKPTLSKTDALELGLQASSMNPFAIMRLVKFFFPNKVANLSDAEMQKLAQLIINEDAELLQNAVTNMEARNQLLAIVDRKISNLQKLSTTPVARTATEGVGFSPEGTMEFGFGEDENVAKQFLSGTSKGTQNKIMQSVNN